MHCVNSAPTFEQRPLFTLNHDVRNLQRTSKLPLLAVGYQQNIQRHCASDTEEHGVIQSIYEWFECAFQRVPNH